MPKVMVSLRSADFI